MNVNSDQVSIDTVSRREVRYERLFRKFIGLTLVCSLVPLLLVGWGMNLHYSRFAKSRMTNTFRTQVEYHCKMIELFLQDRSARLQLIADTHPPAYLARPANLGHVFEMINRENWSITDLGVIDETGRHMAYIGPYDLMDKNYSDAFWFREVIKKGLYISDMFSGFRKEPHFIIAVARSDGNRQWILRATIDTEVFRSLVENVRIGTTGEVFLLNREGIFQTSPRFSGEIMEQSSFPVDPIHEGIRIRILKNHLNPGDPKEIPRRIIAEAWLANPQWLLVVSQEYSEAFDAVNHANRTTLVLLHISAISIFFATYFITRYMVKVIKKRDQEADQLNRQLLQTGKMASIGELSAGVAHEINNPLAIILTERQILLDQAHQTPVLDIEFRKQFLESLSQIEIQIQRCKRITHNLLRFSRRTQSLIETVDLNAFLLEVMDLVDREAKTSGIQFIADLENDLPPFLSDPSQLQQVFLNLITNAIYAHNGKPSGTIRIATRSSSERQGIEVVVSDTGAGIASEHLDKIFDPFFTTKPVGKGTGLGLSICYSIIKQLGGTITVESRKGKGTDFFLFFPFSPPQELKDSLASGEKATES